MLAQLDTKEGVPLLAEPVCLLTFRQMHLIDFTRGPTAFLCTELLAKCAQCHVNVTIVAEHPCQSLGAHYALPKFLQSDLAVHALLQAAGPASQILCHPLQLLHLLLPINQSVL